MSEQSYTREQILANRKAWTDALRSGEYGQRTGALGNDDEGFCCLGVACKVAEDAGVIGGYDPTDGWPPVQVQNWLGLADEQGQVIVTEAQVFDGDAEDPDAAFDTALIELNDSYGRTFEQIADVIDGYLPIGLPE